MNFRIALLAAALAGSAIVPEVWAQDPQAQLWDASISGDTAAINRALAAGANIDSLDTRQNQNGRRPLNWAAYHNRGPAVSMLLARGASINAVNRTGFTPVHHAAEAGSMDALRILLEAGADFTIPNLRGTLPIETARNQDHPEAAQMLQAAEERKKARE